MIANIIRNAKKTVTGGDPYYSAVSLLLPMDGTNGSTNFVDSGPNALAVTAVGNAQISTTQSKYGGASGYFDGTGDYLSVASNACSFGTGDFTVEFWFRAAAISTAYQHVVGDLSNSTTMGFGFYNRIYATTISVGYTGTTFLSANQWYHYACVRQSGIMKLYLNGVVDATFSVSTNLSNTAFTVGMQGGTLHPFSGYLDDIRISKFARYTSAFTPPTAASPTTASSTPADPYYGYTSLLLHMDGSSGSTNFVDSGPNALAVTASGSAQISTAQSKFGGASASLNASTNTYLSIADNDTFYMPADFTIEAWVWIDGGTNAIQAIYSQRQSGSNGFQATITYNAGVYQTWMWIDSTHIFTYQSGSSIPTSQWVHLAWTRSGTTFRSFINGVLNQTSTSSIAPINQAAPVIIGEAPGYSQIFKGYIDDLRITKGLARFTSSFTPPAQAHPNIYNPYTTLPVSGAALWLDASQQNTIFTDAGTTPVTTSGQSVYQWNDLSGNNRHAVQATSGNRPTWLPPASGQNGLGAVGFNGSNQLISTATSGLSAQPFEYYIVFKFKSTTTNDRIVFGTGDRGNFDGNSGGGWNLFSGALLAGGTRTGTSWAMVNCKFNGSSSALRINASQVLSGNTGTGYPTAFSLAGNGSSDWGDITVAEFVVYSSTLSTGDQNLVESYLKTKWGTP